MATVEAVREAQQFIGGEWVDAEGGETFDVTRPVHRRGRRARARRRRGPMPRAPSQRRPQRFRPGRRRLPPSGSAIFLKAADVLESRLEEVVGLLARETGATFGFGMFQMHFVPGPAAAGGGAGVRAGRRGDPVGPSRARSRWACAGRSASSGRSRPGTPR